MSKGDNLATVLLSTLMLNTNIAKSKDQQLLHISMKVVVKPYALSHWQSEGGGRYVLAVK